jgi:hypothetical protein
MMPPAYRPSSKCALASVTQRRGKHHEIDHIDGRMAAVMSGSNSRLRCGFAWAGFATLAMAATAYAQQPPPALEQQMTAYVVMTPTGPATCATWVQWRAPGANRIDREGIQYWAEGYISGLAAGSRHNILGAFRLPDLGAWLDRYCTANPQTKLPLALNALGREMLAHPGGKL